MLYEILSHVLKIFDALWNVGFLTALFRLHALKKNIF